jgi:hypothetical protein
MADPDSPSSIVRPQPEMEVPRRSKKRGARCGCRHSIVRMIADRQKPLLNKELIGKRPGGAVTVQRRVAMDSASSSQGRLHRNSDAISVVHTHAVAKMEEEPAQSPHSIWPSPDSEDPKNRVTAA